MYAWQAAALLLTTLYTTSGQQCYLLETGPLLLQLLCMR